MWMCVIRGSAFLWHQVRCMMAVLFMIGKGEDDESVIDLLFDVEQIKDRPNYDIAPDANLILSDCGFDDVEWTNDSLAADVETYKVYQRQFEESAIAMCLSEVMMRQYHERPGLKEGDKALAQYPPIKQQGETVQWEEIVERVTKARKKQRPGDEVSIIRRAVAGKKREIKAEGKK
ncbi:hypothetical protein FGO68_gene9426 [Halteria grandinella]|uniref:tRNA pseudouridine synthase n=1 Tax=Halteria grandinella TaxID=5974 RepID=A0A8J8NF70_HALGN|nr:hypothetical protein FGO68_gene9426 [Halteria grandinella]